MGHASVDHDPSALTNDLEAGRFRDQSRRLAQAAPALRRAATQSRSDPASRRRSTPGPYRRDRRGGNDGIERRLPRFAVRNRAHHGGRGAEYGKWRVATCRAAFGMDRFGALDWLDLSQQTPALDGTANVHHQ